MINWFEYLDSLTWKAKTAKRVEAKDDKRMVYKKKSAEPIVPVFGKDSLRLSVSGKLGDVL